MGWGLLPMVVMTVPAKKKELPRSHRLVSLEGVPTGLTPALIADTTCCGRTTTVTNMT